MGDYRDLNDNTYAVMRGGREPPFRDHEGRIRRQFQAMFARAGFDARRDSAGVVLKLWGRAYLAPQPRVFFGRDGRPSPGDVPRAAPFRRMAFANSDASGIMDPRASITEAGRAVGQILAAGETRRRALPRRRSWPGL